MAHIQYLGLKNFRVFGEDGHLFEFAPITLVTGANNSGKSSILKAFILLQNSLEKFPTLEKLDFSKGLHHLGDYSNVLKNNKNNEITITIPFPFFHKKSICIELAFKGNQNSRNFYPELEHMSIVDNATQEKILEFISLPFKQEKKFDPEKSSSEDQYELVTYKYKSIFNTTLYLEYAQKIFDKWTIHKKAIDDYEEEKNRRAEGGKNWFAAAFLDPKIDIEKVYKIVTKKNYNEEKTLNIKITNNYRDLLYNSKKEPEYHIFQEALKVNERPFINEEVVLKRNDTEPYFQYADEDQGTKLVELYVDFLPVNPQIRTLLRKSLEEAFKYLHHNFKEHISHVPSARGNLSRMYTLEGDSFNHLITEFVSLELHTARWAQDFINKWIKRLQIGDYESLEIRPLHDFHLNQIRLVNKDKQRQKYLVDFGYGTLQLIAILLKIVLEAGKNLRSGPDSDYGREEEFTPHTILIEEPETNLHPNWQSILAEIFLDAAKEFNAQFIIETHSEYLIRNFQNLVAKKKVNHDGLVLFYVNEENRIKEGANQVEKLSFSEDGSLDYNRIGTGFFDEQYNLTLSLLNIKRDQFITDFKALKSQISADKSVISALEKRIDDFTERQELLNYQLAVDDLIGGAQNRNKMELDSFQFLASAKFLIANLDGQVDYSPIVIQCGRAVEKELLSVFKSYKTTIKALTVTSPTIRASANNAIDSNSTWFIGMSPKKLTDGIRGNKDFKFVEMQKSIEALIEPNARSITLFNQLAIHLDSKFDLNMILQPQFISIIDCIRDERNKAGHTYNSFLTKKEALGLMDKTDKFIKIWVGAKK